LERHRGDLHTSSRFARRALALQDAVESNDGILLSIMAQGALTAAATKREDLSEALDYANAWLVRTRKQHRKHPSSALARRSLAAALGQVAAVERALGELSAAGERLVEADELFASLSPVGMPVHASMLEEL